MSEPNRTVSDDTRKIEHDDARRPAGADRAPTPDESTLAERAARDLDPTAAEQYEEMLRRGAQVKGEGEITPEP